MKINLISDTVTKPTAAMLEAMMNAKVGDDVFKDDAAVNELEQKVAYMFGKEAALFFPSGIMANQTAIKVHTQPGDQLITDKDAHIFNYEGGGVSFNSGVSCKLIDGKNGQFTANDVINAINPPDFYHSPLTSLVCLENTANRGGGACWNFEEILEIRKVCDENNLGLHLDGARLWNALVAKNETPKQYGAIFDSISVCLSKGLGCPVGSVLTGSKKFMEKALRVRKVLGGGMRQAGYLAAAGIYALDYHIDRLKEDHKRAQELAQVLSEASYIKSIDPVETNILIFYLDDKVALADFMQALSSKDIAIINMGSGKLRMVTHLDYTEEMHEKVLETLKQIKF
ncbi:aminotransferase class I/II-fold pyridoxal phosphate-dependent enzyme [Galbibacter sp. BG1]|uniref:threonine aldolase family protein n=1 Tax=Galbibacter sp. BG1 TaxID=1170699 RepID=UPI0015BBA42A|nr:GntG family PLP-dependent aldolase [Galbibacter sp. BG1]QLE02941.1 aminotransferase class I/II-fold pyridoxal phosphate-dependent enzyme [Galbibacter sp. BG1]